VSSFDHDLDTVQSLIPVHFPKNERIFDETTGIYRSYFYSAEWIIKSTNCTFFVTIGLVK
jgi:hypothetical protein